MWKQNGTEVLLLFKYDTSFYTKKINIEEKAGERLRQARSLLNLSLKQVADKTGIKEEYLIYMENENFSALPSGLYGKNFIKRYAEFLKINPSEIINKTPFVDKELQDDPFSKKILKSKNFLVFPKIVRNLLLILVIIVFFGYLSFYLLKAREMPELVIYEPENNISIEENTIEISGRTNPNASLSINGKTILLENGGYFSANIDLRQGINQINIVSQKKYSQENIIEKQILVQ